MSQTQLIDILILIWFLAKLWIKVTTSNTCSDYKGSSPRFGFLECEEQKEIVCSSIECFLCFFFILSILCF